MDAETLTQRLSSRLAIEGECRVWIGRLSQKGYGLLMIDGQKKRAHRAVWELAHGPVPAGLMIRHRCDNPRCCRLEHLEIGTALDNARDAVERGRHARGTRKRNAKLNDALVASLLERLACGEALATLAREAGVDRKTLRDVRDGIGWPHVPRPSAARSSAA